MFGKETFVNKIKDKNLTDLYFIKNDLGQGSYGKVFQVKNKITGETRACKQLAIKHIQNYEKFMLEINILSKMDHPNIIKLYEVFEDKRFVYLVMEECTGGELFDKIIDRLQNDSIFTEKEAAKIFKQMMMAIAYCHKEGICHRDLKPENLLLLNKKDDTNIKIIDFGLSNIFIDKKGVEIKMTSKVGTAYYVSPEVLSGNYDKSCDIWSAGVILYILLCGDPPFNGANDNDIYKKIKTKKFGYTNPLWTNVSNDAKELINMMLSDPDVRPTAEEVLQNSWVKDLAPNSNESILKLNPSSLKTYGNASKFEKAVATFICSRLKDEDVEHLKEVFMAIDKNGDGHLSLEEMIEGMSKVGFDKKQVEDLFKEIDTDKSGAVDYTGRRFFNL
jgi:calcium-dependent protein kinase